MRLLSIFALTLVVFLGFGALAQELDDESSVTNAQIEASRDLPSTLIIRAKDATNEVEVLHLREKLAADPATLTSLAGEFRKLPIGTTMSGGELDYESSASSWYFWFNGAYTYPTYWYYGYSYNYASYYSFRHGGYTYWYARWAYGWWY